MAIETNNTGYTESASYYADPNNVEVPDQTHQEHNKGINSYILATLPGLITGTNYDDEILNIKQANGLLAIRQAILGNTAVNSNYYYAVDEYEDQTGVDSTTMTYDAATDSYRTAAASTHSLLIQSEESGTVTDGSQYFYDKSTNKAEITASGNAQTHIPAGGADLDPYGGTEPVILLNGTTDYLTTPDSTAYTFGTDDFTVCAWAKFDSVSGNDVIVSRWDAGSQNSIMLWRTGTEIAFYFNSVESGNNTAATSSGLGITTGVWYYIMAQRSSNTLDLYVDGSSVITPVNMTGLTVRDSTLALEIGSRGSGTLDFMDGQVSDIRLFKSAISTTKPTSKPTVSTESLYVDHDITKTDSWGNATASLDATGVHTISNPATEKVRHSLSQSKFGNSGLYFDGTNYLTAPDSDDWNINGVSFTAEAWIKVPASAYSSAQVIFGQWTIGDLNWVLQHNGSGQIRFLYSVDGTNAVTTQATATGTFSADTWAHVAVDYDQPTTTLRIYVDGDVDYTNSSFAPALRNASSVLEVGVYSTSNQFFTGYMEEVSFIKGTARYAGAFTRPSAPYSLATVDPDIDSITFTAGSAPTKIAVVTLMEPIDSVTVNTDYNIFVSPTASFANSQKVTLSYAGVEPSSGANMYVGEADISGLTSGTSVRYYLRGENAKDLRHHAIYLYYAD